MISFLLHTPVELFACCKPTSLYSCMWSKFVPAKSYSSVPIIIWHATNEVNYIWCCKVHCVFDFWVKYRNICIQYPVHSHSTYSASFSLIIEYSFTWQISVGNKYKMAQFTGRHIFYILVLLSAAWFLVLIFQLGKPMDLVDKRFHVIEI